MTNELIIKKVGVEDVPTIRGLAQKVWPFTYRDILTKDQIEYMMELFYSEASLKEQFITNTFIIAYLDDKPVGFASYSGKQVFKLHKLYVNTAIQGRGLGSALINFIIDEMKSFGGEALELNVNRNNKAKMFYERLGFEVVREEDIDIGDGYWMNDFVMQKRVRR